MKRFSLRWLLLVSVLGAIMIAFTAFAVYLDGVERDNRIADIDAELLRAERAVTAPPGPDGPVAGPPGVAGDANAVDLEPRPPDVAGITDAVDPPVQLLLDADGAIVAESGASNPFGQETLGGLVEGSGSRTISDPRYRVRVTSRAEGSVVVTALPLDEFDSAVKRFRTALVAGGGVILLLVAAVLSVLTRFLARPVSRMAEAANRIAAGDLETTVGHPSGSRETADLAVDLERMVARLRGAIDESNRARQATERLLADMAHEIRTPLTALKGYSDLYAKGMLQEATDVDRAMSRIGSESERLSALANAMLQLAHEGTALHDVDDFDLAEVAHEVASDLRAAYPDQRIDVHVDHEGPHQVEGSRNRVQQAILNLGSNACHHNPAGKPVGFAVRRDGDVIAFTVADHGHGVDIEDRERIFLPFYRSDAARDRDGQRGAGLGLALTKQIAEQHGGAVSVAPTAGGGATFRLVIPAAPVRDARGA